MANPIELSIVIVTYKSKEYIAKCIQSIREATQGLSSEIIIVDNASGDDSTDVIRAGFPEVVLVENEKNEGFARGINKGVKLCSGRYLAILNPDTQVNPETFKILLNFLENHQLNCIVGPRTVDEKGTPIPSCRSLPHIGNIIKYPLVLLLRGKMVKNPKRYLLDIWEQDKTIDVTKYDGYITGACIITRLDFFKEMGMFDERYFLYGEDIDFGFRMRKAGYQAFFVSEASVIHHVGRSASQNVESPLYFVDAYLHYIHKNFTFFHGIVYKVCFFMLVLGRTIEACLRLKRGETLALIKVLKHFNFFRSGGVLVCQDTH